MKKVLLLSVFFVAGYLSAQAQCQHAGKKSCHPKAELSSISTAAAQLASMDESILVKKSVTTGEACYLRKEVCPHSGSVSLVSVVFDGNSQTFVNQSPQESTVSGSAHSSNSSSGHCSEAMKAACKKICSPEMKAACAIKCAKMGGGVKVSEVAPTGNKEVRS